MNRLLLLTGVVALLAPPPALHAQVNDPRPADGSVLALEWSKPFLDQGDFGFVTSTLMARALVPVGEDLRLMGNWGISHASLDGVSSTSLSNLELGVMFVDDENESRGHVSVVAPLTKQFGDDDFSVLTGFATDIERLDRYLPDLWSINAMVRPALGERFGAKAGASVLFPEDEDTEVLARYGVYGRTGGSLQLGVELSGYAILTESDLDLGERTLHQITASLGWTQGSTFPELFVRLPIDEDGRGLIDAVAGVRVTF